MAPLAQILVHWCHHFALAVRLSVPWNRTKTVPRLVCNFSFATVIWCNMQLRILNIGVVSVCLESPVSPLDASLMKMTVVDPDRPDPTLKSVPDGLCVMVLTRSLMQGNLPPAESAVLPPIAPPSESPKAVLPEWSLFVASTRTSQICRNHIHTHIYIL